MPLIKVSIDDWASTLKKEKNMIDIQALANLFQQPEFTKKDFWDEKAGFRRFMTMLPGNNGKLVSRFSAICLGLLWCKGSK